MMFKKITAIFFLTFASCIMLAFAVLPHHHHQEFICFNHSHCESPVSETPHSHDDSPFSDKGGCVKHLFQTQINRHQSFIHDCTKGHCCHFIQTLFLAGDLFAFLSFEAENYTFSPEYYQEKLHSICHISHISGRAPPYQG